MAFKIVQELEFESIDYAYEREGDVLDISFGPPAPAIALQVEDWLAIQVRISPPALQGMTIVGFKKIFEKINRYVEKELPKRMKRLARVTLSLAYDDDSDTLIVRTGEEPNALRKLLKRLGFQPAGRPSIFEPLMACTAPATAAGEPLRNVYVEKSLPSKDILGMKILHYTQCGEAALEGAAAAIIDTLFEPDAEHDENVHLITNALLQRFDWQRFATLAT